MEKNPSQLVVETHGVELGVVAFGVGGVNEAEGYFFDVGIGRDLEGGGVGVGGVGGSAVVEGEAEGDDSEWVRLDHDGLDSEGFELGG